ncbi:MAG: filamentous hemagglutinin N-terminal protein, partial [Moraxellaceae bacterium]|nr:filamentous hemagglutinin N-terminal protein [Moraxellaceae bacterium]
MRSERRKSKRHYTVAGFLQRLRQRWLARRLFAASSLAVAVGAFAAPAPTELPTGGNVVGGSASISQNAATLTVQQSSSRAAIDWNTFNVGQDARVEFVQPSASSVVLNRVLDSRPSEIFGNITANGQVFLVNPSGMYFSPTAQVDVGGLVATTHDIGNDAFMAGGTTFRRNGATGAVINAGNLKAQLGGYIALLAPEVRNEGIIVAQLGTAALAAGESFTLNISGGRTLASITVTPSQIAALVENKHLVQAPGGLIILSARAASALQGAVVQSGTLEATGMSMRNGRIVLEASGSIHNSGIVRADAGLDGPAGVISLDAPDIVNSGLISALAPADSSFQAGGLIAMQATAIAQGATGVIDVSSGAGAAGRITLDASNAVAISGELRAFSAGDAPGTATGGEISIQAGGDVTLNNATVDASGADAGGEIRIDAGVPAPAPLPVPNEAPTLALTGSTTLRSGSRRGSAGSTTLTGDNVWLQDTTSIDATGATGGGLVQVGGSWQNSDSSVRQATNTYVGHDVVIDASATGNGDGGSIAVWSDITDMASITRAFGTLLAKGGATGGDGGRIETSGYFLDVAGITANASAAFGANGTWLLDPYNVYIANWASGDAYSPPNFTPTTQTSSILASTITSQLNANTNVT